MENIAASVLIVGVFVLVLMGLLYLVLHYRKLCTYRVYDRATDQYFKRIVGIEEYQLKYNQLLNKVNLIFDGLPSDEESSIQEIKKRLVRLDLNKLPFEPKKLSKEPIGRPLFYGAQRG